MSSREKYLDQKKQAKQRNIPWLFNYITWWRIWCRSGKWKKRGIYKGCFVMSRPGDKGPYAPWNVEIIRCERNHREGNLGRKCSTRTKAIMSNNTRNSWKDPDFRSKMFNRAHRERISKSLVGNRRKRDKGKKCMLTDSLGRRSVYPSVSTAARANNLSKQRLYAVARGDQEYHMGYKCRYIGDQ